MRFIFKGIWFCVPKLLLKSLEYFDRALNPLKSYTTFYQNKNSVFVFHSFFTSLPLALVFISAQMFLQNYYSKGQLKKYHSSWYKMQFSDVMYIECSVRYVILFFQLVVVHTNTNSSLGGCKIIYRS